MNSACGLQMPFAMRSNPKSKIQNIKSSTGQDVGDGAQHEGRRRGAGVLVADAALAQVAGAALGGQQRDGGLGARFGGSGGGGKGGGQVGPRGGGGGQRLLGGNERVEH